MWQAHRDARAGVERRSTPARDGNSMNQWAPRRADMIVISVLGFVVLAACSSAGGAEGPVSTVSTESVGATTPDSGTADTAIVASAPPATAAAPRTGSPARCAPPADEPVEIVIWHALGDDGGQMLTELTDRFNADHPDITVRLERRGSRADAVEGLAEVPPDERPDAVLGDPRSLRTMYDTDFLVTPDECGNEGLLTTDGYLDVIDAAYSIAGELQAVPFNVSVPVVMYDGRIFRDAGLDPADPPGTLEEVAAASEAIVDAGVAPHGLIAWDGYGPWFVTHHDARRGELTGTPDNGRLGEPVRTVDFATPAAVDAFSWLRDEVDAGRAVWIGENPSGFDDLLLLVDRGKGGAMTFTTCAAIGDVARVIAAGSFDDPVTGARPELGVGPLPGPDGGALVGGGGFFLIDSGAPARVGATATYIDWLTAPAQHGEFAAFTGFSPLRESEAELDVVQDAWEEVPQLRVGYDQLVGLPGDPAHAGPAWGAGEAINLILSETLTAVVEGGDPEALLDDASDQVNEILAVYNGGLDD